MDREKALELVRASLDRAAYKAGKGFADQVAEANLHHFSTILDYWRGTGVLDIEDVDLSSNRLTFRITRCGYVEKYREMGLPEELVRTLSCCRDEPFARGYSPFLRMEREETIGGGYAACGFVFLWEEE